MRAALDDTATPPARAAARPEPLTTELLVLAEHGKTKIFDAHYADTVRALDEKFFYHASMPVPVVATGAWGQAILRTSATWDMNKSADVRAIIYPGTKAEDFISGVRAAAKQEPDPATVPDFVTAITVFDHGKHGTKAVKLYPDFPKAADAERFILFFPQEKAAMVAAWVGDRADARVSQHYGILEFSADGGPLRPRFARDQRPSADPAPSAG